jgi:hypothetical protein
MVAGMRGLVVSGVGVLLAAVLVGCSSGADGEPATKLPPTHSSDPTTTAPSTTASPTPRPTPKPTPSKPAKPTLPAVAKQDTAAGAAAAAAYWIHTFSYAFETGDVRPMTAASTSRCIACANYSAGIRAELRQGWKYESSSVKVQNQRTRNFRMRDATIRFDLITAHVRMYSPKRHKTQLGSSPERKIVDGSVVWSSDQWRADSIDLGQ